MPRSGILVHWSNVWAMRVINYLDIQLAVPDSFGTYVYLACTRSPQAATVPTSRSSGPAPPNSVVAATSSRYRDCEPARPGSGLAAGRRAWAVTLATAAVVAVDLIGTAAASAASAASEPTMSVMAARAVVRGHLDVVAGGKRRIHVIGWSWDPGRPMRPTPRTSSSIRWWGAPGRGRTWTGSMHVTGRYGFNAVPASRPGRHQV